MQGAAGRVAGTVDVSSPGVSGTISYGASAPAPAPAASVASFATKACLTRLDIEGSIAAVVDRVGLMITM